MAYFLRFTNLFVCVLWIAQIHQCVCYELGQNSSSSKFTTSFLQPYSVTAIQAETSVSPQSCRSTVKDAYAIMVRKLLRRKDKLNASVLQQLMVRGFQRLCFWSERVKEKFKVHSQLSSDDHQSLSLPGTFVTSAEQGQLQFGNITIIHFPSHSEKIEANPLSANCTGVFKTTYQAKSNQTTIKGEMLANSTRIEFLLVYENATILSNDIKTLAKNGSILSTRLSAEFSFDSFIAHTSNNQDVHLLLNLVTPALLRQFITNDPSGRIAYAGIRQNVKIDEYNKREIIRLLANVLTHYLRILYTKPYRLPARTDHANHLPDTIEYVQMDGLHRCEVYGSDLSLNRRSGNLVMKLAFSINFLNDEKENVTTLTVRERDSVSQNKTVVLNKILIKLEFSAPLELDQRSDLRFYVKAVKAEIIGEHRTSWFQSLKPKLNAFFGEIFTQIVLSWILYETN